MPQEVKHEIHEDEPDPLRLLAYSWTVEARNEKEAIFKAAERATGIPRRILETLITVMLRGSGIYVLVNRKTKSSIMARVTAQSRTLEFYRLMITPRKWTGERTYYVTFYPRTYKAEAPKPTTKQ